MIQLKQSSKWSEIYGMTIYRYQCSSTPIIPYLPFNFLPMAKSIGWKKLAFHIFPIDLMSVRLVGLLTEFKFQTAKSAQWVWNVSKLIDSLTGGVGINLPSTDRTETALLPLREDELWKISSKCQKIYVFGINCWTLLKGTERCVYVRVCVFVRVCLCLCLCLWLYLCL